MQFWRFVTAILLGVCATLAGPFPGSPSTAMANASDVFLVYDTLTEDELAATDIVGARLRWVRLSFNTPIEESWLPRKTLTALAQKMAEDLPSRADDNLAVRLLANMVPRVPRLCMNLKVEVDRAGPLAEVNSSALQAVTSGDLLKALSIIESAPPKLIQAADANAVARLDITREILQSLIPPYPAIRIMTENFRATHAANWKCFSVGFDLKPDNSYIAFYSNEGTKKICGETVTYYFDRVGNWRRMSGQAPN